MSMVLTGDADVDRVRREVVATRTDAETSEERYLVMITWRHLLQRLGVDTTPIGPTHHELWKAFRSGDRAAAFVAMDRQFAALERLQSAMADHPPAEVASESPNAPEIAPGSDWPMYGRDVRHTSSTNEPGPQRGVVAWKRPMGLAWYPQPAIEDGRLYVASPGMRTMAYCLDPATGEQIWKSRRNPADHGPIESIAAHMTHCSGSTPLLLKDHVVINEIGAQHRNTAARDLIYLRKTDGGLEKRVPSGHLDYRAGYATLAGDDSVLVYTTGEQRIDATPPVMVATSRIVCKETASGETLWDFYVGPMFADPLLDSGRVYAGTADGMVFAINVSTSSKNHGEWDAAPRERVAWQFKAGGAVNSSLVIDDGVLYFGANDGSVYAIDATSGKQRWRRGPGPVESRAFKHFSSARVEDGRLYIGAANRRLYCLSANRGEVLWEHECDEWIRSRPLCVGGAIVATLLDGTICRVNPGGDSPTVEWETRLGTHPILSDPIESGGRIYVTSSDLFLWCVDASSGEVVWRHSLIECIYENGERIATDMVAAVAGGHFQSKPTAAAGKIFYGTPARFVYALDYRTGRELWRFELGAAVSGSPTYSDGRVFVGQQGGEEHFYALNAEDGTLAWKQTLGWVWSSATPSEGRLFIPGVDGYVNCLKERDGSILWRYRTGSAAHPEPPVDNGRVYIGSWDHYDYALNVQDGSLAWQFYTGGKPDSGAPLVDNGRLFLPMGGNSFRCMDAETGAVIWEHRDPKLGYNASPALHDGRVFISTSERDFGLSVTSWIICLDAASGQEVWRHRGGGLTAPSVADGKVYFACTSDPFFYCVDEKGNGDGTTRTLFSIRMGDRVFESVPPIYAGMAFLCCRDGYFYAFA